MAIDKIKRGFTNPIKAFSYLMLILNGFYYKLKYTVLKRNVRIGKNFKVHGKFSFRGPGKLTIGNNVFVDGTSHSVTPWTCDTNAEIVIGNNVFLNGTRFGCHKRIDIGDDCIIADCRILDTDFHSTMPQKRNDPKFIKSAPIKIGKNVWIALDCVILRGVSIGDNSTISAKSVVYNDVPAYCIYGGNPAVLIKKISQNMS